MGRRSPGPRVEEEPRRRFDVVSGRWWVPAEQTGLIFVEGTSELCHNTTFIIICPLVSVRRSGLER